jgi:hypothetical protein
MNLFLRIVSSSLWGLIALLGAGKRSRSLEVAFLMWRSGFIFYFSELGRCDFGAEMRSGGWVPFSRKNPGRRFGRVAPGALPRRAF